MAQHGLSNELPVERTASHHVVIIGGGIAGLSVYQRPTNYFDASISFDVTDNFTIYGQASNLTGEHERYYLTWEDQVGWDQIYERRFVAGVRAKF